MLQLRHGCFDDFVRREAKLSLQGLERGGSPEGLHSDDCPARTYVTLPAEDRGLFHRNAGPYARRKDALPVVLGLVFKNVPRGHRNYPGANPLGDKLFVSLDGEDELAARSNQNDLRAPVRWVPQYVGAARNASGGGVLLPIESR